MQKNKFTGDAFKNRSFKAGGYSFALTLIVVALVVAVNVIVAKLPRSITAPDISSLKLYDFTVQTKDIAKGIDEEIRIKVWAKENTSDKTVSEFLSRYAELNALITVKYVDPELNPLFAEKYGEDALTANSIVIESDKRFKIVDTYDIYGYDYTEEEWYYYLYSYGTQPPPNVFNAESAISSAVDYVTTDVLPVIYKLAGHGEADLPLSMVEAFVRGNYELKDLSLLPLDAVPEDASCVLIVSPSSDITESELETLLKYMSGGGSIVLFTDYGEIWPNISGLCESYGLKAVDGITLETAGNFVSMYQYLLIAQKSNHAVTMPLIEAKRHVLLSLAHGIEKIDSYRATLTIDTLLGTSEGAYIKDATVEIATLEKEEGDANGPFMLGVAVTENLGDKESKFTWFSTSSLILDDNIDSMAAGGNKDLVLNTLGWIAEMKQGVTIRSLSLDSGYLLISEGEATFWGVLLTVVLPLALVGTGFAIWFLRSKRR